MKVDLKTAQALTSEEVRDTLLLFRNHGEDPLRIEESFKGMFPKKIAQAMVELRLQRRRATTKFSRGLDMFFTKEQLQVATSESVAAYRAERFQKAGIESVFDPCCGIGSDTIAMAKLGIHVTASDKEPSAVHFAEANAEEYGVEGIEFKVAEVSEEPPGEGALYLDPARRRGSRRIMSPDDWSPNPEQVAALLQGRPAACVKLSPAVAIDTLLEKFPTPDEIEVISLKGEAKETVFWYGALASGSERRATSLPAVESYHGVLNGQAPVGELGGYLHDPDPALVHAGLLGAFAEENTLNTLDPEIAYLSGEAPVFSPFLDTFRVLACESLDPRKMRAVLRDLEVGRMDIRKRGIAERPQALHTRLFPKTYGERVVTLLAARVGERHLGIVAEPVEAPE